MGPRLLAFRPTFRSVHRWLGLWGGLWLFFMGFTGTLLVMAPVLEEAIHPDLYRVEEKSTRATLASCKVEVERACPDRAVVRLEVAHGPNEVHRFFLDKKGPLVLVDPYSGKVLGSREKTLMGIVHPWHVALLPGNFGKNVTGVVVPIALTILATGWLLTSPDPRKLMKPRPTAYDFHRWLGWLSTPGLVIAACSGFLLVFYGPIESALKTDAPVASQGSPTTSLDDTVNRALALFPGAELQRVQFPDKPAKPVTVRLRQAGEPNPTGRTFVRYSTDGSYDVEDARKVNPAVWLMQCAFRLHTYLFDFTPLRICLGLLGLVPGLLVASGLKMRWKRSKSMNLYLIKRQDPNPLRR